MAISVSVSALIGLINTIRSTGQQYILNARNASGFIIRIMEQVAACVPTLEIVLEVLQEDSNDSKQLKRALSDSGVLNQAYECLRKLEKLVSQYPEMSKGKKLWTTLKWPITNQNKAEELLKQLNDLKCTITMALTAEGSLGLRSIGREIHQIESKVTDTEKRNILAWFKPNGVDAHAVHLEKCNLRVDETCDWMTDSDYWKDFLQGGGLTCRRFLWIHGIPGAGKTILASFLIDKAAEYCHRKNYSYYYCSHERNKDETRDFLHWIIWDLTRRFKPIFMPQQLADLYDHRVASFETLLNCFHAVSKQFGKRVYIVVDGVDESKQPRDHFLNVLTTIGTAEEYEHVSLLMVSREEPDIKAAVNAANRAVPSVSRPSAFSSPQASPSKSSPIQQIHVPVVPSPPKRKIPSSGTPPPGAKRHGSSPRPSSVPPRLANVSPARGLGNLSPLPATRSDFAGFGTSFVNAIPIDDDVFGSTSNDVTNSNSRVPTRQPQPSVTRPVRHPHLHLPRKESLEPACTTLSMSNPFVTKAIGIYVHTRLNKVEPFRSWQPRAFVTHIERTLTRRANGMFRWVACQVDMIISGKLFSETLIQKTLDNLPGTVFETYERIILNATTQADNRTFARTALSLICSDSAEIPDADVLVEASRFCVPHGTLHCFTIERLTEILGCLIKATTLKKKPASHWKHDDESGKVLKRISLAHYTVKEYLFAKSTAQGPASDFALTTESALTLELQVVFNGLQHYSNPRLPGQRQPTRYEEYSLRMSEKALRSHRGLIAREDSVREAVFRCLRWSSPHYLAFANTNKPIREAFPIWLRLYVFSEESHPGHVETSVLVHLILLQWPELLKLYLGTVSQDRREEIWTDQFYMSSEKTGRPRTVLQLCVLHRRIDLLRILIDHGANFNNEPEIVLLAMKHPYGEGNDNDDGTTTGQLLQLLLERGADPQPGGFRFTPLQMAVYYLEERWVHSLLSEDPDPNVVGVVDGENPYPDCPVENAWHRHHPLKICREAMPPWNNDHPDEMADQIEKSRRHITSMLVDYGAVEMEVIESLSDDVDVDEVDHKVDVNMHWDGARAC